MLAALQCRQAVSSFLSAGKDSDKMQLQLWLPFTLASTAWLVAFDLKFSFWERECRGDIDSSGNNEQSPRVIVE